MAKYDITESLRRVLENNGIPECCYSIGKYRIGATCIEKIETGWTVYYAGRSEKFNKKEYERSIDAARELISRITVSKELEAELQDDFNNDVIFAVIDLGLI